MSLRSSRPALLALALGVALTGCSDDGADVRGTSGSSSTSTSGSSSTTSGGRDCANPAASGTTIAVTMSEYVIETAATAKAGRLTFAVTNGGKDPHELVIVKSDDAASLPRVTSTDPATNATVDEDKLPAGSFVGEVEGIPAGKTCGGSFALTAGSYVLFCNIVEVAADKPVNHFDLGMQTKITVS